MNINGVNLIEERFHQEDCTDVYDVCCDFKSLSAKSELEAPVSIENIELEKVGRRNIEGVIDMRRRNEEKRILFGEFPWMVSVFNNEKDFIGGGSLIRDYAVLTGEIFEV